MIDLLIDLLLNILYCLTSLDQFFKAPEILLDPYLHNWYHLAFATGQQLACNKLMFRSSKYSKCENSTLSEVRGFLSQRIFAKPV